MRKILRYPAVHLICWYLAFTLSGFVLLPCTAQAAFVSSSQIALDGLDTATLTGVRDALEESVLAEKLTALGLSPEEVKSRLDALTVDERQAVLADMEQIQAGGDGLVGLLLLVAIILLILHLTDKKVVIQ